MLHAYYFFLVDSIENAQTSKLDTSFPESTDLDSVFKTQGTFTIVLIK